MVNQSNQISTCRWEAKIFELAISPYAGAVLLYVVSQSDQSIRTRYCDKPITLIDTRTRSAINQSNHVNPYVQVEAKIFELQEAMSERGYSEEEITKKVQQ